MTTSARVQAAYRPKKAFPWGRTFAWIGMALLLFVTLFPFWWMIRTALTAPKAVFLDTSSLLPVQATLINFQRVLGLVDPATAIAMGGSGQSINFGRSIANSVIVSILVVADKRPSAQWRPMPLPACAFPSAMACLPSTLQR